MKVCGACKEEKSYSEFNKKAAYKDGYLNRCRPCEKTARQSWTTPGYDYNIDRKNGLMKHYKMTLETYEEMFKAQEGLCAICKEPERRTTAKGAVQMLAVDHDHSCCPGRSSCGECVKQLLCTRCNTTIGSANDNPALLRAMADYVEATRPPSNVTLVTF